MWILKNWSKNFENWPFLGQKTAFFDPSPRKKWYPNFARKSYQGSGKCFNWPKNWYMHGNRFLNLGFFPFLGGIKVEKITDLSDFGQKHRCFVSVTGQKRPIFQNFWPHFQNSLEPHIYIFWPILGLIEAFLGPKWLFFNWFLTHFALYKSLGILGNFSFSPRYPSLRLRTWLLNRCAEFEYPGHFENYAEISGYLFKTKQNKSEKSGLPPIPLWP